MTDRHTRDFPAVFDYDNDRIPADLLVRWTRQNSDRLVLADLGVFLATAAGLTIGLVGAAGLVIGSAGAATGIAVLLLGLVIATAALLVRRRLRHRSGLRGRDIDLVLAHRTEIGFQPWNELAGRGRPVPTWPEEAQLAHRAGRAITAIQDTQIWAEPDLLDHRLRLDLPEASRQIHVASWQIHQLRKDLGPRPVGPGAEPLAAEWDAAATHLQSSLQVLRQHVEAIESYRHTIDDRNGELLRQRRHDRLRDQSDGAAAQLAAQDAAHELATDHLTGLRRELERSTAGGPLSLDDSGSGTSPRT